MLNVFSNPVFIPLFLVVLSIGFWWILSQATLSEKKEVLNVFIDKAGYVLLGAFTINGLAHLNEILELPYRALILSTEAVSLSFLGVMAYSLLRYFKDERKDHTLLFILFQMILFIGIINHSYYYILYNSPLMVGLLLLFVGLLLFSSIVPLKGNRWMYASLIGLVLHLMITKNQAVLYLGFVIPPELVAMAAAEWGIFIVGLSRRKKQSKQI
ncbi:MAG: hypothetical protein WBA84_05830 [Carnobacterium sp.]|uniref:hypothetical protein n=1 Tax=Carnobacterium sp. TaxID=48221 RepID=UPI003C75C2FC